MLHGGEIRMVCWLMPDTLHVRVVVPLALPPVAMIAQALVNPFAIENGTA